MPKKRVHDDDNDEAVQLLSRLIADNLELSEQEILELFNDEVKDNEKVRRASFNISSAEREQTELENAGLSADSRALSWPHSHMLIGYMRVPRPTSASWSTFSATHFTAVVDERHLETNVCFNRLGRSG